MLERLLAFLGYLYLIRVPLLVWALVLLLCNFGFPSGSVLPGIFDISQPETEWPVVILQFAIASLAAGLTAAAMAICSRLIVINAQPRFGVMGFRSSPGIELLFRVIPISAAFFVCLAAVYQSRANIWLKLAGIVLGVVSFYFITHVLQNWIWDRYVAQTSRKRETGVAALLLLAACGAFREQRPRFGIAMLFTATLIVALIWKGKALIDFLRKGLWIPGDRVGYIENDQLQPRHLFSLFQLGFSLWVYALYFISKFSTPAGPPLVPTLSLILLLLMLVCYALSAISFFADRYRVPVLLFLFAYASLVSSFPEGDHFFRGAPGPRLDNTLLSPKDVLTKGGDKPIVLVATTGGGIQAAAWTTRVLTGLAEDSKQEHFAESVRLISSVSGGSVGAMMFIAEYTNGKLPNSGPPDSHQSVLSSEASSLDQLTWGLAYPDLLFSLAPFLKQGALLTKDRGWTLEDAWAKSMGPSLDGATLWQWRDLASKGAIPSIIFNSTLVESGKRFLISTADFERKCLSFHEPSPGQSADTYGLHAGREEFRNQYCGSDIDIVTAARLSATFPFVSPAARMIRADENVGQLEPHVVDGGYYDNYGMATLLDWLTQALKDNHGSTQPILIVEIRSSAVESVDEPAKQGWTLQSFNPLLTIWNVRGTSQLSRNELEYELLRRSYPDVSIDHVVFELNQPDERGDHRVDPLNWHLTPADKEALRDEWAKKHEDGRAKVKAFLARTPVEGEAAP